ncbi:MAG: hypothetical protein Q9227_002771 [Pyrenula ochraceoflavens]
MALYDCSRRRLYLFVAVAGGFILLFYSSLVVHRDPASSSFDIPPIPIPERPIPPPLTKDPIPAPPPSSFEHGASEEPDEVVDHHPIARLMHDANLKVAHYEDNISKTFRETVAKYRTKYGRHPPPGFKEWYKFARKRNVYNIDDFEQVMDDLRPFWALQPSYLRNLGAHLWDDEKNGISGIHIRKKKIVKTTNEGWRIQTTAKMIQTFVKHLPDMDIAMNRLDQPRIIVPWEEMQGMLAKEQETRLFHPEALDSFTTDQQGLLDVRIKDPKSDNATREKYDFFNYSGKQYMDIAKLACPAESPANNASIPVTEADALYKLEDAGLVSNFNKSSDLCTIGPVVERKHGFLFTASTIIATHKLLPIFGECKVNVNSDILFPANMYYQRDARYEYSDKHDLNWEDKKSIMFWRGVTSGGVQMPDNWQTMHRQRLVQLLNGTQVALDNKDVTVLSEVPNTSEDEISPAVYEKHENFHPSQFAMKHTDVGFTDRWACVPNCSFYEDVFAHVKQVDLTDQFQYKYLIDVDGHSFSGRWRAFLYSKSLAFKATIFREWHDSRLFAWRHFVPVDNRYDDLYALLTYFIGYGKPPAQREDPSDDPNSNVYVPNHEREGKKIGSQGQEWARKVLRKEDMEVYMFRLLLEYARVCDDNRERIGYSGDGSELDKFDDQEAKSSSAGSRWGLGGIGALVGIGDG